MKYTDLVATSIDLKEYYDNHVRIYDPDRLQKFNGKNLAVCPLHDDNDPSMGIIMDKRVKTKQRYHCFGCGKYGDVVTLHQEMQKRANKRTITYEQSAKELAQMYNLDLNWEEVEKNNPTYAEEMAHADRKSMELFNSRGTRFTPRTYTKQFRKITGLKMDGGSPRELAHNLDRLNVRLKENNQL